VFFGVATLVIGLSWRPLGGIVELSTLAGALLGASLLPAICVGLGGRQVTARAAGASVVLGLFGAIAGKLAPGVLGVRSPWLQDIFVGLAAASLPLLPGLLARARPASAPVAR
jgi:Na+/proline symporter